MATHDRAADPLCPGDVLAGFLVGMDGVKKDQCGRLTGVGPVKLLLVQVNEPQATRVFQCKQEAPCNLAVPLGREPDRVPRIVVDTDDALLGRLPRDDSPRREAEQRADLDDRSGKPIGFFDELVQQLEFSFIERTVQKPLVGEAVESTHQGEQVLPVPQQITHVDKPCADRADPLGRRMAARH